VVHSLRVELRCDNLHLPRTCRQIEKESKPLLDTMTTLLLARYSRWVTKDALDRQGASFSTVQEVQIRPERTCDFLDYYRCRLTGSRLFRLRDFCGDLVRNLPVLQCLVFDTRFAHDHDDNVCAVRLIFGSSELKIRYAEWCDVLGLRRVGTLLGH
jgi:hypothetical protein